MRRTILLFAARGVALPVAGSLALVSGLGGTGPAMAQAQKRPYHAITLPITLSGDVSHPYPSLRS
jgi:hypothetical protein